MLRMKTRIAPPRMPGMLSGMTMRRQLPPWRGAEVGGGVEQGPVEPLQRQQDGQNGVGQIDVEQAELDRELVEQEDVERLLDDAEADQDVVDEAVVSEQRNQAKVRTT